MPKLLSITFCDNDSYYLFGSDDSCDEIERINVELNSVTTVCLRGISMKKIHQILMYSFPNLQYIILDRTELPSKENELTSFLGQKIQRMISYEYFSGKNITQETDISYLCNLKHLKLSYYGKDNGEELNSRSRIISNLLTKLRKLETLSIYAISSSSANPKSIFDEIMNGLDEDEIKTEYEIKYSGNYMRFIRNSVS